MIFEALNSGETALLVDDMALQALLIEDPVGPLLLLLTQDQLQLRVPHQRQLQICQGRLLIMSVVLTGGLLYYLLFFRKNYVPLLFWTLPLDSIGMHQHLIPVPTGTVPVLILPDTGYPVWPDTDFPAIYLPIPKANCF